MRLAGEQLLWARTLRAPVEKETAAHIDGKGVLLGIQQSPGENVGVDDTHRVHLE